MIAGYVVASPSMSIVPLLFLRRDSLIPEPVLQCIPVPGAPVCAVEVGTDWFLVDATTGKGDDGRTVTVDQNYSVSRYVVVYPSGVMAAIDNPADAGANPCGQVTYTPATNKWTARKA